MILDEGRGNLASLSSNVFQRIKYLGKEGAGENSKVEILKDTPENIFNLLMKDRNNNRNIIIAIVRYGQDDLFLLEPYWSDISVRGLVDWDDIVDDYNWNERPNIQSNIKAASGLKRFINNVASFLSLHFETKRKKIISKKDILSKINYQIIYKDEEREKTKSKRLLDKKNNKTVTRNNITTPSNSSMGKSELKDRLKDFILSKLPKYDNPDDLPKGIEFLNSKTKFKLMGCPYTFDEYNSTKADYNDLLNGGLMYFAFENEKRYDSESIFGKYPRFIIFVIKMNKSFTLYVSDIYFAGNRGYSFKGEDLEDISKFKEYVENIKGNNND